MQTGISSRSETVDEATGGSEGPSSMEQVIPGLSLDDFFEVYKILVKHELLENQVLERDCLEKFSITQDFMLHEDIESQIEERDIFLPEASIAHCADVAINRTPQSMVEFVDLREIYEKVQSRAGGGSHQRVSSGLINIKATSEGQLCGINVFVQRDPDAAVLCGDTNGKIPLDVSHEAFRENQQLFSVDLDSVYDSPSGTPVYKLATVDAERRNLFNLIVMLKFIDGTQSGPFMSKPFLLRSRKPGSRTNSLELS